MKISNFKIRDRLLHKNKLDSLQAQNFDFEKKDSQHQTHLINSDFKFDIFMEKFQQYMNFQMAKNSQNNQKQQNKFFKYNFEPDCRDKFVLIDLPQFQNNQIVLQDLQIWIGELSREVLSASFNYYSTGKFTYEQSKVYASQSFLRNICRLAERYDIKAEQLKFIDKKMKQEIFPYLKTKYPMTNQKDSNKSLQKVIKQINNIEVLTNDFFYYTDLEFSFREDGRYDDLIMRLINQIMSKVNQKPFNTNDQSQLTNFKDFESFMTSIFQKTYDEQWMNTKNVEEKDLKYVTENILQNEKISAITDKKIRRKQSLLLAQNLMKDQFQANIKNEAEKQKYKLQVQQYTNFQIGRKISENTQFFSQDQIKSKFLTIKSPAVLRILSKWCDELWQKFDNQNYFIERTQGIRMQKGKQINIVYPWFKVKLKTQMKKEKQNILKFMKEIEQVNYFQQMLLLKNQLKNVTALHIDKIERVAGKFSCKIVNNLQNFIILYLNRLIHGLTTVSKICYLQMNTMPSWPNPPNLISFKIGDLMRCKFSSKQREVLKVFQEIQKINDQNPQKMKIIRIKNRLKLGTNDVLINVRFNNLITCQIQLAVSSTKTQFIKCSYNFSHYVYQIQRSSFGSISQLCSIWRNLQNRSNQFNKLIQKQKPQKQVQIIQKSLCHKSNISHTFIENTMPFICCQCGKAYYQNNYMLSHVKCSKCEYWKCAVCQINQKKQLKNKNLFLTEPVLNSNCTFLETETIPEYGICIFIKKKPLQPIIFKCLQYSQKQYLFKKNKSQNNKEQIMRQIGTIHERKKFLNQCILFQLASNIGENYINIGIDQAKNSFIIPSYIEKCFKLQKQTISILGEQLPKINLDVLSKTTKQQKKCIKYIQFSSTKLTNMDLISPDFVNLDCLNMNINQIEDISKILLFPKLQKLYMLSNKIVKIPPEIQNLIKLKEINFFQNQISELPQSFCQLKSLVFLKINNNKLQKLPDKFYQLQNLKQLIANNNCFKQFPISLAKHQKIELINLMANKITIMPQQIQQLGNLRQLLLNSNQMKALPKMMKKMKKLQIVDLSTNSLSQFSKSIGDWTNIRQIKLNFNAIRQLTFQLQMQNLKHFRSILLNNNHIQSINNSFQHLLSVESIKLSRNRINKLSQQCFSLEQLKQIDLSFNQIQTICPNTFKLCNNILKINLSDNKFLQFPQKMLNLQSLTEFTVTKNQINKFPQFFIQLPHLKIVNLPRFNIRFIPQDIGRMIGLESLYLPQNSIQNIPDSLGNLQSLQILDLYMNKISFLNPCIFKLTKIKELILSNNVIQQLLDKFQTLKNLKILHINKNKLKIIPKSITQYQLLDFQFQGNLIQVLASKFMTHYNDQINLIDWKLKQIQDVGKSLVRNQIKKFRLRDNCFEQIPKVLLTYPNIILVDLSFNLLKSITGISNWKHLQHLNIQRNPIQSLPQEIGDLSELIILNLKCENLRYIPKSIQKIKLNTISLLGNKLQTIQNLSSIHAISVDFSHQNLQLLSQNIGDLINAQNIKFQRNILQSLPQSIGKLVKLSQINITNQKLKNLPQSIGNLINLKQLLINNNQIQKIPDSIGKLRNLEKLSIHCNKLKQLPSSIGNLENLDQIIFRYNQIQQIPFGLEKMSKLIAFSGRVNKIKQIPISVYTESLKSFYMQDNQIKNISKEIEKMKNLQKGKLYLSGNPIQEIEAYDFIIQKGDFNTIAWAQEWKKNKQRVNEPAQKKEEQTTS